MKKKKKGRKKVALFDIDKEYKKHYATYPTQSKGIPDYGKVTEQIKKQVLDYDDREFNIDELQENL